MRTRMALENYHCVIIPKVQRKANEAILHGFGAESFR